jgi:hypothetical protein
LASAWPEEDVALEECKRAPQVAPRLFHGAKGSDNASIKNARNGLRVQASRLTKAVAKTFSTDVSDNVRMFIGRHAYDVLDGLWLQAK